MNILEANKQKVVGTNIVCPSCKRIFKKKTYQHTFCCSTCKDAYWNKVDPRKRNNTARISPASAAYMSAKRSKYPTDNLIPSQRYEDDNCYVAKCDFCEQVDCECDD